MDRWLLLTAGLLGGVIVAQQGWLGGPPQDRQQRGARAPTGVRAGSASPGSRGHRRPLAQLSRAERRALRETDVVRAVRRVADAVIAITSTRTILQDPQFESRFGKVYIDPRQILSVTSLGSGVIVDPQGYAVTNEHVISEASSISVQLADGRRFRAKVVGAAPAYDLALIRIQSGRSLPYAVLGESEGLMPGETAIAIGNPYGLDQTVSRGVVSTPKRTLLGKERALTDLIQTDASINPGNSGGPLVNLAGEVIGINTMGLRGGAQGVGFAIPASRVRLVISDLRRYGKVRHPWLGLRVKQRPKGLGVVVSHVKAGGPAQRAGIRPGDVILALDGHRVADVYVFRRLAKALVPGQRVHVVLAHRAVTVQVGGTNAPRALMVNADFVRRMGFQLADAADYADHYRLKTRRGAVIVSVRRGGQAWRQNLRPGDVVVGINRHLIRSVADVNRVVASLHRGHQFILVVQRGAKVYDVVMRN